MYFVTGLLLTLLQQQLFGPDLYQLHTGSLLLVEQYFNAFNYGLDPFYILYVPHSLFW